jgi:hypothetical protein
MSMLYVMWGTSVLVGQLLALQEGNCCGLDDQGIIHQVLACEKFSLIFKASRQPEASPASYSVCAQGKAAWPGSKPLFSV